MKLDPSAVSRMLHGERRMQIEEATKIAGFLAEPVKEVLRQAGVPVEAYERTPKIMLAETIDEKGQLNKLAVSRPLPKHILDRAKSVLNKSDAKKFVAAQVHASNGPISYLDDALIIYRQGSDPEDLFEALGVLSVCRSRSGEQILAKLTRKIGVNRQVIGIDGVPRDFDLASASPVLAVIP